MSADPEVARLADRIRRLAERALAALPDGDPARAAARTARVRPIDYMRWAEFGAVLASLEAAGALEPGRRLLDLASPQWLAIALAEAHPRVEIVYANVVDAELAPYARIAEVLGLRNLQHAREDVRGLGFADASFDDVISVSVLEHVFPEVGGDEAALAELARILRPGGRLHLTVPCKARRNVVYLRGPVYERAGAARKFFAREYDRAQFDDLVARSAFVTEDAELICERPGPPALDAFQWGPRSNALSRAAVQAAQLFTERALGRCFEANLAGRYLTRTRGAPEGRLVNLAAVLRKAS